MNNINSYQKVRFSVIENCLKILALWILMTVSLFAIKPDPTISDWNEIAHSVMFRVPNPARSVLIDMAYLHIAIYDAVNAIDARYTSFAINPGVLPWGSKEAAVAAAARKILLKFYSADSLYIDSVYNARISIIPSGDSKTKGIQIGNWVTTEFLATRNGDGSEVVVNYNWKDAGLGVYQPTPPGSPQYQPASPWIAQLHPFSFSSPSQFRAPAPLAYNSEAYAEDFNEVKKYGSLDSSFTTPEQREIARFHTENPNIQVVRNIRLFANSCDLTLEENARLYAQIYVSIADALITGWDTKYFFNCWRPVTAIRMGDIDDNPSTIQDTSWQPLVGTPRHPEYPAAHGCVSAAIAYTIERFFGTSDIPMKLTSNVTGTEHNFTSTKDFLKEIVNSRVYGGMHFRSSVRTGVEIGRKVAEWVADNHFRPIQTNTARGWIVQNSGLPQSINPTLIFSAVDSNVCWGIQDDVVNAKCVLTTDGGTNWKIIEVTGTAGLSGLTIYGLNAQTAWATFDHPSENSGGGIYKTTNGGVDWNRQSAFEGTGGHPRRIHFFDENNGICAGDPRNGYWEICTTTNGGDNWNRVPATNIPAPGSQFDWVLHDSKVGSSYWLNVFSGSIYNTSDMGKSWKKIFQVPAFGTVGITSAFRDSHNGLAAWYFGTHVNSAMRTTDGGTTWTDLPAPPLTPSFYFMSYIPGQNGGYLVTSHNNIGNPEPTTPGSLLSNDNGETWVQIDNLPHGPSSFTKSGVGWSGGPGAIIYKWSSEVTSVNASKKLVLEYRLEQNYPNPFNPSTTFGFSLPSPEFVKFTVYDILGREVALLMNENKEAGNYKIQFNAQNLSTGVYLYKMKAGKFEQTRKFLLMK